MRNNGIRRWLGVAIVPLTLLMLGVASPASAASFACDNDQSPTGPAPIPTTLSETNRQGGDMTITRSTPGDCIIEHELFAVGFINISTMDGNIIFQGANQNVDSLNGDVNLTANKGQIAGSNTDIKAGKVITMTALDGPQGADGITLGDIIANTKNLQTEAEGDGNMLIVTDGNLNAGKIRANGTAGPSSKRSGSIQIDVNLNNPTSSFKIGGPGANVDLIDTRSTDGGGTNAINVDTGVRITNGLPSATGGMEVDPDAIKVRNSNSRSGWLELNARKGTLKVLSGSLTSAGLNDQSAGAIYLFAQTIDFDENSRVTVSQSDDAPGVFHQIIIAADLIKFKGEEGLEILANGGGLNASTPAALYVFAEGGIESISNNNVLFFNWILRFPSGSPFMQHEGPLHFEGEGTAPLRIAANGDHSQVAIGGYPIKFDGGQTQIFAKGDVNHLIIMGFFAPSKYTGSQGIEINNSGIFEINANGESDMGSNANGGDIQIQTDKAIVALPDNVLRLFAKGPNDASGDGGTISFDSTSLDLGDTSKINVNASASTSATGTGSAVIERDQRKAIFFSAGSSNITLGRADNTIEFTAEGAPGDGNGGAIEIKTSGNVNVRNNTDLVSAAAIGNNGNGGEILIDSAKTAFNQNLFSSGPIDTALNASGGLSTGTGGKIEIPLAEAKSGGNIEVLSVNSLMNVDGGLLEASPTFYGSIKLNTVECVQVLTDNQTWPLTAWQCNGASGISDVIQGANTLLPQLRTQADSIENILPDTPPIHIYSMKNINDYVLFFDQIGTPFFQTNILGRSHDRNARVSAAFDDVFAINDQGTLVSVDARVWAGSFEASPLSIGTIRQHTIQHEVGHQFAFLWGTNSLPIPHTTENSPLNIALENAIRDDESLVGGPNIRQDGTPRPCNEVFGPVTCGLPQVQGLNNTFVFFFRYAGNDLDRYQNEIFAMTFGEINSDSPNNFGNIPEIERFIGLMQNTNQTISGFLTAPLPTPNQ